MICYVLLVCSFEESGVSEIIEGEHAWYNIIPGTTKYKLADVARQSLPNWHVNVI